MTLITILLWVIIILALLSIIQNILNYKDDRYRSVGKVVARIYLLVVYLIIGFGTISIDSSRVLVRLGLISLLLDEVVSWFILYLGQRNRK